MNRTAVCTEILDIPKLVDGGHKNIFCEYSESKDVEFFILVKTMKTLRKNNVTLVVSNKILESIPNR